MVAYSVLSREAGRQRMHQELSAIRAAVPNEIVFCVLA